jgi:hypothetical protein
MIPRIIPFLSWSRHYDLPTLATVLHHFSSFNKLGVKFYIKNIIHIYLLKLRPYQLEVKLLRNLKINNQKLKTTNLLANQHMINDFYLLTNM